MFRVFKGIEESSRPEATVTDSDHLLIEKKSFWGRTRVVPVQVGDLTPGMGIFSTWKSRKTGEGFLIQFLPPSELKETNLANARYYGDERADLSTMEKVFNHIAAKK